MQSLNFKKCAKIFIEKHLGHQILLNKYRGCYGNSDVMVTVTAVMVTVTAPKYYSTLPDPKMNFVNPPTFVIQWSDF